MYARGNRGGCSYRGLGDGSGVHSKRTVWLALAGLLLQLSQAAALSIVYTCLGPSFDHQRYIWLSVLQMRTSNPRLTVHIVFDNATLANSSFTRQRQHQFSFETHVYNPGSLGGLHNEFKDRFFVQGEMTPDGNKDFNLYTTQRLFAVHWLMESQGLTDVWHLENDNLIYESLDRYQPVLEDCKVRLAVPFAEEKQAVAGIMYARDAPALGRLLEFVVSVFKMGREEAIRFVGTEWLNDMTILAKFFSPSNSSALNGGDGGLVKLPSTNTYKPGENCLWDRQPVLFDANVMGQWFGGTYGDPTENHWEKTRNFDPRPLSWEWRNSPDGFRVPYVGEWRIINIHVHSKHLIQFVSAPNVRPGA